MATVEYAPGRRADVFGDAADPAVLMWHGAQSDSRAALETLAELVAGHGLRVVTADWDSHADDGGRSDLLASLRYVAAPDLVLVGWSMGGLAAAGATVSAAPLGLDLRHTVCLAGAFMMPDPITGGPPETRLTPGAAGSPFTLLHGTADDVVPVDASRRFAARLTAVGWPVDVVELDTDHAAIAGAVYDPVADRYSAGRDPETVATARDVAARIAAVAGR